MKIKKKIRAFIFDWGDTVMRDIPGKEGPMFLWDEVAWIPYAENALQAITSRYICCIATSAEHSDTQAMIKALKRVGAHVYFHHFYSSHELKHKKPDPGFFEAIAERLHVPVNECLMVGNLYDKDIAAAKKAGMKTLFFNEYNLSGDFPDADFIISSFTEFDIVLSEISSPDEKK